jgi:Ca2+-binding RTX toxin-like protein
MPSARTTLPALIAAACLTAAPAAHAEGAGVMQGGDATAALRTAGAAAKSGLLITVNGQVLSVTGTKRSDRVKVTCDGTGYVKVNKKPPSTGQALCSQIVEVDVIAGAGNDRIDLSGVGRQFGKANFPNFGFGTGAAGLLGPGKDNFLGSQRGFNLVLGNAGADTARGGQVRDIFDAGTGDDRMIGRGGRDIILGKPGADRLLGGDEADILSGNGGGDLVAGEAGADLMGGGGGNDTLIGGPGRDRMLGGFGSDSLRGGAGPDVEQEEPPKKGKKQ